MSSEEEFDVDEILEQRKRKGVLEYLVRWQGFNELYDSWEPVTSLTNCSTAIKSFLAKKKRSRSKSRSRSRGRQSKSRSSSRGRKKAVESPKARSRSRSASRKTAQSSSTTTATSSKSTSKVVVAKREASPPKEQSRGRSRSSTRSKAVEVKASASKSEVTSERISSTREGGILERKTELVTKTIETVQATPVKQQTETMTTRSRLAVRQVENDQRPAPPKSSPEKETWVWWFADHAVLILFIIISIIALSFTIESVSGVRDKLTPDFGVLQQRLAESYQHSVDAITHVFQVIVDVLPAWGDSSVDTSTKASPTPKTAQETA